jgi:hypothetical protein
MSIPRYTLAVCAAGVLASVACTRALTPEEASARGDAMLREMSKNLAALQTFAYTADERREVVKDGGKSERHTSRRVTVRRPNGISFTSTQDDALGAAWYDGKSLTLLSNRSKVWARGPMPPALDEALDFLATEYAVPLPSADLLYSSPYDALMTKDTTGGWVDQQRIGQQTCDHLAYRQEIVDWEIWLSPKRHLPCQFKITYKSDPGQPSSTVTYSDFDPAPQVTDATFTARIPDGYQRIKIMRHAAVADPNVEAAAEPDKNRKK